ncbi:hypothetical protein BD324DRAFT_681085 [Kockovaella imperatae]|uniref:Fcf2 pre-rRNA processing C-terminal domain-containing protein n=1 Tax=Kockovaella imperatae TaxID=4999 RepID=A0A1Y1UI50_9TREE|nr:hypothetical protein BD324DRAFT_681085 [Kockovaella imperatae]ORX37166.1 hypothetical protein BD324DRAFT_681085 [Kockovaella imperatae]
MPRRLSVPEHETAPPPRRGRSSMPVSDGEGLVFDVSLPAHLTAADERMVHEASEILSHSPDLQPTARALRHARINEAKSQSPLLSSSQSRLPRSRTGSIAASEASSSTPSRKPNSRRTTPRAATPAAAVAGSSSLIPPSNKRSTRMSSGSGSGSGSTAPVPDELANASSVTVLGGDALEDDTVSSASSSSSSSSSASASSSSGSSTSTDSESESGAGSESDSDVTDEEEDSEAEEERLEKLLQSARLSAQQNGQGKGIEGSAGFDEDVLQLTADDGQETIQAPIPNLNIPQLPTPYLTFKSDGTAESSGSRKLVKPSLQAIKSRDTLELDDRPYEKAMSKREKAAQPRKTTVSQQWATLPAPKRDDLPQMKRDYQALALANSLDPKRFMKGGTKLTRVPETFAIGHLVDAPRHLQDTTIQRETRYTPGSVVQGLVRDEGTGSYAKRKYSDLQKTRMDNGRGKGWKKRSKW